MDNLLIHNFTEKFYKLYFFPLSVGLCRSFLSLNFFDEVAKISPKQQKKNYNASSHLLGVELVQKESQNEKKDYSITFRALCDQAKAGLMDPSSSNI